MKKIDSDLCAEAHFLQHGLVHNESWPSLIFLDLVAARELIVIGAFYEPSVVLWIPLKQTLCPRPRRPYVQGIGRRAGLPLRWLSASTWPAVIYAAPISVVVYTAPIPAVCTATMPANEHVASVPFICHRGSSMKHGHH